MARKRRGNPVHGWLVIDKPPGLTSTQVVGKLRRIFDAQKVGHGGTLDPLATGVLPIAFGEATKTVAYVLDGDKSYEFTLRWGQATDTDDSEGKVIEELPGRPSAAEIQAALGGFIGVIEQVPPTFSAVKIAGNRAYDLARAEQKVTLEPRRVQIYDFSLLGASDPDHATFHVNCAKGTYMRALARDLGRVLGTAAHIVSLRRTAAGGFTQADAISLASLEALSHSAAALEHLLPVEAALDGIPALILTEPEANRLRCGQAVSLLTRADRERIRDLTQGATVCAMAAGKPVALARFEAGDLRPLRVLNL